MGRANCERYLIKALLTVYSKASCHINEEFNDAGKGMCETFSDCRGERSCIDNKCIGDANCEKYIVKINKSSVLLNDKKSKKKRKLFNLLSLFKRQKPRAPNSFKKKKLAKKYTYMYETTYKDYLWKGMMVNKKMVENYLRYIQSDDSRFFGFSAKMNRAVYCKSDFCYKPSVNIFS